MLTLVSARGGAYALAAARALPSATQVADRWHLMENASRAFLDAVRASMRPIRVAIGATVVNPALLSAPSVFNMKAPSDAKRPPPPSSAMRRPVLRSRRLSVEPATAGAMFGPCCAASGRRCSARGKARSRSISPGSTANGLQGAAMAQSSGGASGTRASADHCAWLPNGRPAAGERKRPKVCIAYLPPAPSLG